jgi:hypothetical protein
MYYQNGVNTGAVGCGRTAPTLAPTNIIYPSTRLIIAPNKLPSPNKMINLKSSIQNPRSAIKTPLDSAVKNSTIVLVIAPYRRRPRSNIRPHSLYPVLRFASFFAKRHSPPHLFLFVFRKFTQKDPKGFWKPFGSPRTRPSTIGKQKGQLESQPSWHSPKCKDIIDQIYPKTKQF